MDPALVDALTCVESNFDADAVSAAGARGLMQLMPVTAHYVDTNAVLDAGKLDDPALNLELGQRYVIQLATQDAIDGNLLRLLASYNAGLGGYLHWAATMHDDGDPLLFIVAIPNDETWRFVERVLTYTWVYAARLHVPAPSLDDMAGEDSRASRRLRCGQDRLGFAALMAGAAGRYRRQHHGADRRKPSVHRGEHRRADSIRHAHGGK